MVFLGANVLFPEYSGSNSYYKDNCFEKFPRTVDVKENPQWENCMQNSEKERQEFESNKLTYEGTKYVFITLFNLLVLLLALFLPKIQNSIIIGLFFGSIIATFSATIRYFDTNSRIGFVILVLTFFTMLYFINHKKNKF